MTVENFDKYMELAKVLNHTWGTGSQFHSLTSQTIRFNILDDKKLRATLTMIVNFPNDPKVIREMRDKYRDESLAKMKGAIKELAEKFKDETGNTLKLKLVDESVSDTVEFTSNAQYRQTMSAFFRLNCFIDVQ